ncbi:hypothetical protein [Phocaeicola plebeius]|uniref:hypothetical protein n=1 Tax=Phocaeicola plebeius TaxID=310297 RepID=UPI0026F176D3|nr:hypothetical protein [Phocaeicola plebeius]
MGFNLGNLKISSIYVGSTKVSKAYIGTSPVFIEGLKPEAAPNGIYIQHINDLLYTEEQWTTKWNDNAVGIAVISDNCRFVIAPNEVSFEKIWANSTPVSIEGLTPIDDLSLAKNDYNGVANTDKISAVFSSVESSAAAACKSYLFKNGKSGYLGSCGEWNEVINNKATISKYLQLIEGVDFLGGTFCYWTSTLSSDRSAWGAELGQSYLTFGTYVFSAKRPTRAFCNL